MDWKLAKCKEIPTNAFYPFGSVNAARTAGGEELEAQIGQQICKGGSDGFVCPVINECLEFALKNRQDDGVWGGESSEARRVILRRRRRKAKAA